MRYKVFHPKGYQVPYEDTKIQHVIEQSEPVCTNSGYEVGMFQKYHTLVHKRVGVWARPDFWETGKINIIFSLWEIKTLTH